jgi:discoidin domain receptor family protein 2
MELNDKTYDGEDQGVRLTNGLGQLTDGQKGADNFRKDDGYGNGKGIVLNLSKIIF